jgi:hypothetical protein
MNFQFKSYLHYAYFQQCQDTIALGDFTDSASEEVQSRTGLLWLIKTWYTMGITVQVNLVHIVLIH